MTAAPLAPTAFDPPSRRRLWVEIALVLGLSLGASAVYSLVAIADLLTRPDPIGDQSTSLNPPLDDRVVFDVVYRLLAIAFDLVPVALVVFLLWRAARPHLARLGLSFDRTGRDVASGVALALVIGVPGIALYLAGRGLGLTVEVQASEMETYWWTVPVLLLSSVRAAVTEEVIVIGYLFARLRDLRLGIWPIIVGSAVLRGTYHLYQGVPAFIGNVAMGLLFGWLYARCGRLVPFVIAHFLIDAAVFIGYPYAVALLPDLFG